MGLFDKITKMCNEEKQKVLRNQQQANCRRKPEEDAFNHLMKTLENASGIKKEDIINMKVKSVERRK